MNICRIAIACCAAILLTACQTDTAMTRAADEGWHHYGFDDRDRGPHVSIGALEGGESNVIIEGEIVDVCAVKGCWMNLADGDDRVFVRFQDYAFFVPRNAAGHRAILHGTALKQVASVEELRHYAEDANASPAEIAAITEPETRITFFADSVYIQGDNLDEPHRQ